MRLLVADADGAFRRFAAAAVAGPDDAVLEATHGAQALALAADERPDAVLLDLALPGLDALTVCRRLKHHPDLRGAAVVATATAVGPMTRDLALAAGADAFAAKPLAEAELAALVRGVVRGADAGAKART